jgi:hypothetical protein
MTPFVLAPRRDIIPFFMGEDGVGGTKNFDRSPIDLVARACVPLGCHGLGRGREGLPRRKRGLGGLS